MEHIGTIISGYLTAAVCTAAIVAVLGYEWSRIVRFAVSC